MLLMVWTISLSLSFMMVYISLMVAILSAQEKALVAAELSRRARRGLGLRA